MYDTVAEAQQKIVNTVVMYDGEPVWVVTAYPGVVLEFYSYVGFNPEKDHPKSIKADITDERWNFQSLGSRLGYMNKENNEALFLYRFGVRKCQQTQGLSDHNVRYLKVGENKFQTLFSNVLGKPGFVEMFQGKYPSLEECKTLVYKRDMKSVAFARKFAIRPDPVGPFYLQYRGRDIGYSTDFYKFILGRDYRYLAESLEPFEDSIKVA